jgi:hypothetical protein
LAHLAAARECARDLPARQPAVGRIELLVGEVTDGGWGEDLFDEDVLP